MKRIILSLTTSLVLSVTFAQTVPNGGFENWTNTFFYHEPNFGITSNLQCFYNLQTGNVQRTNDAFAGNYAAKLITMESDNDTIPGIILIGTPNGSAINGGIPINVRPDSLKCYAKFNIQPNDTASIIVGFRKTGFVDPIGFAQLTFTGVQNSYLEYKALIFWADTFTVPDTLFSIFASSLLNDIPVTPGSELFIDNVGFTGAVGAPNTDFENWTTVESLEPDNWWTPNFALINQTPCVTQSTDAYSGNYALRIENVLSAGLDTIGFASNGYFINEDFAGGMPVLQNPVKVTGYYKYNPVGNDTALVGVFSYQVQCKFRLFRKARLKSCEVNCN
jgi:hypothetical protein